MEKPKLIEYTSLAQGGISDRTPMSTCYDCNNTYRNADGEIDPRSKTIDYILFKSFLPHKVNYVYSTFSLQLCLENS